MKDIPQIDADTKIHATVFGDAAVFNIQPVLDFNGALKGIDGTVEFGQDIVAWVVDDPPVMPGYQFSNDLLVSRDGGDRGRVVIVHQFAVSVHVGAENGA